LSKRKIQPRPSHKGFTDHNRSYVSDGSSLRPWLSDEEFLQKFRVTMIGYSRILESIRDHSVFTSKTKRMAAPEYQLIVFLKYVGTEGDGANNAGQRNLFGIGYRTALNFNILGGQVQK
jgi:hypothetical protein